MTKPGPKKRPPHLQVVRGNPGKRKVEPGVQLPPAELVEPSWYALLGGESFDDELAALTILSGTIELCAAEWARTVPQLTAHGVLTKIDQAMVEDYCLARARLTESERNISRHGITVRGAQGTVVKNPAITAANQYRSAIRFYVGELGLGPSARGGLKVGGSDGDEDQRAAAGILD